MEARQARGDHHASRCHHFFVVEPQGVTVAVRRPSDRGHEPSFDVGHQLSLEALAILDERVERDRGRQIMIREPVLQTELLEREASGWIAEVRCATARFQKHAGRHARPRAHRLAKDATVDALLTQMRGERQRIGARTNDGSVDAAHVRLLTTSGCPVVRPTVDRALDDTLRRSS